MTMTGFSAPWRAVGTCNEPVYSTRKDSGCTTMNSFWTKSRRSKLTCAPRFEIYKEFTYIDRRLSTSNEWNAGEKHLHWMQRLRRKKRAIQLSGSRKQHCRTRSDALVLRCSGWCFLSLLLSQAGWMKMAPDPYVAPVVDSTAVFKDDIFKGKVLFCTGGGSGICRGMTETVVWKRMFDSPFPSSRFTLRCDMVQMRWSWVESSRLSSSFPVYLIYFW